MDRPITFYADIPLADGMLHCRLTQRLLECYSQWNEPRHNNTDYELHVVAAGAAKLHFDQSAPVNLSQRQAILIAPNVFHRVQQAQGRIERFFVSFSAEGDRLNQHFQQSIAQFSVFPVRQDVLTLIGEILQELSDAELYRRPVIEATLTLLVLKALRSHGISLSEPTHKANDSAMERKNIIEYHFKNNMTQHGGAEILAVKLGLSSRQLLRLLREYYGMSYQEKLIKTRMDQALWLLHNTDNSVSSIAEAVGYSSEAAFRKVFCRHFGVSPKEKRHQSRKNIDCE